MGDRFLSFQTRSIKKFRPYSQVVDDGKCAGAAHRFTVPYRRPAARRLLRSRFYRIRNLDRNGNHADVFWPWHLLALSEKAIGIFDVTGKVVSSESGR